MIRQLRQVGSARVAQICNLISHVGRVQLTSKLGLGWTKPTLTSTSKPPIPFPGMRLPDFCRTASPENPTLSPGPVFHPESFFDGSGVRRGPLRGRTS
eukprot:8554416-Pyramimonas_sp.AAC.1